MRESELLNHWLHRSLELPDDSYFFLKSMIVNKRSINSEVKTSYLSDNRYTAPRVSGDLFQLLKWFSKLIWIFWCYNCPFHSCLCIVGRGALCPSSGRRFGQASGWKKKRRRGHQTWPIASSSRTWWPERWEEGWACTRIRRVPQRQGAHRRRGPKGSRRGPKVSRWDGLICTWANINFI